MIQNKRKNNGITLVALVVTIIILLILAGITISSLTNTGLFGRAKEAKEKTQAAEENQAKILEEYETELNQYDEKTFVYQVNKGEIKIGDYVKYLPDTVSTDTILQELKKYSGNTDNTKNNTSTLVQEKLDWRVLDIKDGKVRLISATPTTSTISLDGAKGYNNGVYLLDKTCKTLYNNSKLANNVQNLKIEDIQKYLTYDYTQYENSNVNTGKYEGTKVISDTNYRYYPNLFSKEKSGTVDDMLGTELNFSEQKYPIEETFTQAKINLKVKQTFWKKAMQESDFLNPIYYKLFIKNINYYWLSSRGVGIGITRAYYCIRMAGHEEIKGWDLYMSDNNIDSNTSNFRPIVTLNSNVQIDIENSGDGSTREQAYIIK